MSDQDSRDSGRRATGSSGLAPAEEEDIFGWLGALPDPLGDLVFQHNTMNEYNTMNYTDLLHNDDLENLAGDQGEAAPGGEFPPSGHHSSPVGDDMVAGPPPAAEQQHEQDLLPPIEGGQQAMGSWEDHQDPSGMAAAAAADPGPLGGVDVVMFNALHPMQHAFNSAPRRSPPREGDPQERPMPPNQGGFRHEFRNWTEAQVGMVEHLQQRELNDPTFPRSDEAERQYVEQITNAINDVSNTHDHPPGSTTKPPAAFLKFQDKKYKPKQIQGLAWTLMSRIKVKQNAGPLVPEWQRTRRPAEFRSFAEAIDSLCRTLREQKTISKRLLDPSVVDDVVDHPEAHLKRASQNRRLNRTKAEQIRRGRETTAGQQAQDNAPASGGEPPSKRRKVSGEWAAAAAAGAEEAEEEEEEGEGEEEE
ncbi:MAG: hypothetical protein M1823_003261 [Watsoniomyces obsoletus]|nr:MAG: hypothetical protein M1823_003261 [Watsoniomyces obsoletus]